MTAPPKGRKGSSTGAEPVATTMVSARMSSAAGLGLDGDRLAVPEAWRWPWTTLTFAFSQQRRDAAGEPPDDAVLPRHGPAERSIVGVARREMPSGRLAGGDVPSTFSNSSAAWISALDGMQPTLRQVPPGLLPRR